MDASPPLHPTDQTLFAYGLGKLEGPAASTVDSHLERCDVCRQRVSELSGDSFLGRLRDVGTPSGAAPAAYPSPVASPPMGSPKPPQANASAPHPSPTGSLPPELVNHPQYRVIHELGRGGMGIVYLVRNTMLDRLEVLKVLNKEMLDKKGARATFSPRDAVGGAAEPPEHRGGVRGAGVRAAAGLCDGVRRW